MNEPKIQGVLAAPDGRSLGEGMGEDEHRPLSYGDLRRFFFLVLSFTVLVALVISLAKVLLLFAVVLFMAMVLNTPVTWLHQRKMRRGVSVALVMLTSFVVVGGLLALIVPTVMEQGDEFIVKAPEYGQNIEAQIERIISHYPALQGVIPSSEEVFAQAKNYAQPAAGWLLMNTWSLAGSLFLFVIGILVLIFVLANPQPLVAGVLGVTPARHREAMRRSIVRVSHQMVAWMRATVIMGIITGISTGILLHFAGVRPALLFGVLSAFGELVPNIGPVMAAVPALFAAAGEGPTTLLYAIIAILFVQQIESNILVPFIMSSQMELHPLSIIFFALSMGMLFGVAGAILAVPTAATIKILYDEFYLRPNRVPVAQIEKEAERVVAGSEQARV